MTLIPTVPLIGGQEEWEKITETIERSIMPYLDASRNPLIFASNSHPKPTDNSTPCAEHRLSISPKYLVSHIGFLVKGQAVVLIGKRCEVLKAPVGVYVPKGLPFNLHGKLDEQIPQGEWLTVTITRFGAFVTQCRLTAQAHYEGRKHLVIHPGLPALLEDETCPDKVTMMAVLGLIARSEPFLPTFWELLPISFAEMPSVVRQALQFLHHAYDRPIRLQDVARWCHVNFAHLCRLFRKWVGVSPSAYLVKLRMSAAWKLLTETHLPPILVASIVGYSKWSLFSHQFSKTFGINPTKVRRNVALEPLKGEDYTNTAHN